MMIIKWRVGKQGFISLMGILIASLGCVNAVAAIDAKDVAELNAAAEPVESAGEVVNEQINGWFQKQSLTPGISSKTGKVYYSATAVVAASPESNNWPRSRQIAFKKALNKARAKYIFDKFGNTRTTTESSSYDDSGSGSGRPDENMCAFGQFESYWEKVKALAGAKLDESLREAGVDPDRFRSTPEEKQKELFYESTLTKTIKSASGEISGLIPVQTFEGQSKDGSAVIGVIMMYSPKLYVLADDLRNGRDPTLSGKKSGRPLVEYTDRSKDQLKNMMGLRIVFDEDSRPVLLSYGQWGYSYKGNNARSMERHRLNAFQKADIRSQEELTEFINGKLSMKNESEAGEIVREYITVHCEDGDVVQRNESEEQLIDRLSGQMEIKASAQAAGTTEVKRWNYKNEYGQEIIGVVRAWTLDGLNTARQIKEQKQNLSVARNHEKKGYDANVMASEELSNPEEDF